MHYITIFVNISLVRCIQINVKKKRNVLTVHIIDVYTYTYNRYCFSAKDILRLLIIIIYLNALTSA